VLTPETAGIKKSARGPVALLLADRGPRAAVGTVRHHARDRLLPCPYSTPLGLHLCLFRFPGLAPLGLAGGPHGAGTAGIGQAGRPRAMSLRRQVLMEMAGASSYGKITTRRPQDSATTKKESHFAVTIPGKRRPGRRVG
jgi:hypothetical protein